MKHCVLIGDLHVPYHDERALMAALNFVDDVKPDTLIDVGDFLEFKCFSRHTRKSLPDGTVAESQDAGNQVLDIITGAMKPTAILEGNHDAHITRFILNHAPQFHGLGQIEVPSLLGLDERGIRWVPIDDQRDYTWGGVNIHHGYSTGQNHINNSLRTNPRNQVYGHVHKRGLGSSVRFGGRQFSAMSLGCLCKPWPDWKRGRPSDWNQGIGSIYWDKSSGMIEMVPHPIVDGVLSAHGRLYKG